MSKRKMNGNGMDQSEKPVEDEKDELKNKIIKLQEEKAEMATKLLEKTEKLLEKTDILLEKIEENADLKLKMKEMEAKMKDMEVEIEKLEGPKKKPVTDLHGWNMYKIYVKTILGRTIELNGCSRLDTIANIKARLEVINKTPMDQQRLIFDGENLVDGGTLAYYNIQRGSILDMIVRSREDAE